MDISDTGSLGVKIVARNEGASAQVNEDTRVDRRAGAKPLHASQRDLAVSCDGQEDDMELSPAY
jgi:hypothetical protein